MSKTRIVTFREDDGSVPLLDWLDGLQEKARDKVLVRIELLGKQGHGLRRPHADTLRDGIYELRAKHQRRNLRVLYFFHGREAVILSHGIVKQRADVPDREIERAIDRMRRFESDPEGHTYQDEGDE